MYWVRFTAPFLWCLLLWVIKAFLVSTVLLQISHWYVTLKCLPWALSMWYCTACSLLHIFPQIRHVCPGPQFCLINSCSSAYRSEIREKLSHYGCFFRICIIWCLHLCCRVPWLPGPCCRSPPRTACTRHSSPRTAPWLSPSRTQRRRVGARPLYWQHRASRDSDLALVEMELFWCRVVGAVADVVVDAVCCCLAQVRCLYVEWVL